MSLRSLIFVFLFSLVGLSSVAGTVRDFPDDLESLVGRAQLILEGRPRRIDISTYEMKWDQIGAPFIASLVSAARSGTQVRLLIDNRIHGAPPGLVGYMVRQGIQVRFHSPMRIRWEDVRSPERGFQRFNRRLHDKMFLVDGRAGIIGDKNYKEKFFFDALEGRTRALTMVGKEFVLEDPQAVADLERYFEELWNASTMEEAQSSRLSNRAQRGLERRLEPHLEWIERVLRSRPESRIEAQSPFAYTDFELLIDDRPSFAAPNSVAPKSALGKIFDVLDGVPDGEKILIEHSYFVLFPELIELIGRLRNRGVEIHVALNAPEVTDQWIIGQTLRIDLPRMLDLGLNVHMMTAERRISHAKLIVAGDVVINGSANLDPRSMNINSELAVKFRSPEFAGYLWDLFERDMELRRRACRTEICEDGGGGYAVSEPGLFSPRAFVEVLRPLL